MAWNGPIDGDYTNVDFTRGPWAAGVMTLTHEEVLHVIETTEAIAAEYVPGPDNYYQPISDTYIVPEYNKRDWERGINGDTYNVIKTYDPAVNTLGIDESGIVQPEEHQPDPEPAEPTEPAVDPEPPAEELIGG